MMRSNSILRTGLGLIVLASIFLSGCATATRIHTDVVAQTPSEEFTAIIATQQQEIRTTINRQNSSMIAGQFGLIGSLVGSAIDASVNAKRGKTAETAAGELRNVLLDYQPTKKLSEALSIQLLNSGRNHSINFVTKQITDPDDPAQWIKSSPTKETLHIAYDYAINPAYNGVTVSALVTLHVRGKGKPTKGLTRKLPPVIYQNIISSVRYFPSMHGATLEDKAQELLPNEAQVVRNALDLAFQDIATLIAYDLDIPAPPDQGTYKIDKEARKRHIGPNRYNRGTAPGQIEHVEGKRAYIRSIFGDLESDIN